MRIAQKQRVDSRLGWPILLALQPLVRLAGRIVRRDHATAPRGEIVVVKMLGGGSLLLAFPALLGLKRRYGGLPFTLVCGAGVEPFADALAIFDHIEVIDDRRGLPRLVDDGLRVLARLARRRVDTVLDLEVYSVLSTVFTSLTGARNRIGFYLENTQWRRNVHTHLVFFNRSAGVWHFYDAMVRLLGAAPASLEECRAQMEQLLRPADVAQGNRPLASILEAPFVAIGAGCSDLGRVRQMPLEEWRAFARQRGDLADLPWVFLGGAEEREISAQVARAVADELGARFRPTNLCGEIPLATSIAVLARARSFVGIDSALLHLARLAGTPSVSFWGPTAPVTRLRPIEGLAEVVHYRPPICSPCIHVAEEPPCKGDNVCMRLFTRDAPPFAVWCEDSTGAAVRPPGIE